jgi:hypothetical protein
MALAPIAQDARDISQKLGLSSDLAMIERAWGLEIGALQDVAHIVALDHASLVIEADSHAVMQEVSLRRKELVRKLNHHLPAPMVRQIVVRISQHYGR